MFPGILAIVTTLFLAITHNVFSAAIADAYAFLRDLGASYFGLNVKPVTTSGFTIPDKRSQGRQTRESRSIRQESGTPKG